MPHSENQKQYESFHSEQEKTPTLGELALLAEFDAQRFKATADFPTTREDARSSLQAHAQDSILIKRELQKLAEKGIRSVDEALGVLEKDIQSAERQPSLHEIVRKEIEAKRSAIEFLYNNQNRNLDAYGAFQNWRQDRIAAQAQRIAERGRLRADTDRVKASEQAGAVYQQLGMESPTEREKSREKAAEIVLQEGGVRVHTSVDTNLSQESNGAGFQNLEIRINGGRSSSVAEMIEQRLLTKDDVMQRNRLSDVLKDHGIKEIIDILREIRPVYETVTIPGKKGVLGFGKTPDRIERRDTGRSEPVLHNELVHDGKKEPAVRFIYYIPQTEWRDYSGRSGQMMSVEIVLPESSAKEIEQTLDRDPAAMRKIVERVMKEKLLKDPRAWETPQGAGDPLRPPYEKWDAESNGGKIYIQKEGMQPGFHEACVHRVQK